MVLISQWRLTLLEERSQRLTKALARITAFEEALEPFTQPDLRLRLGGNSPQEGAQSIVFQRNNAILRLKDFDLANELCGEGHE